MERRPQLADRHALGRGWRSHSQIGDRPGGARNDCWLKGSCYRRRRRRRSSKSSKRRRRTSRGFVEEECELAVGRLEMASRLWERWKIWARREGGDDRMTTKGLIAKLITTFPGQVRTDGRKTIAGRKETMLRGIAVRRGPQSLADLDAAEQKTEKVVHLVLPEATEALIRRRF
jgi:hypothetical protein